MVDEGARALFHVTPGGQVTTIFEGAPFCGPADLTIVSRGAETGAAFSTRRAAVQTDEAIGSGDRHAAATA